MSLIRQRKTRDVVLICNRCNSTRETFPPSTEFGAAASWARRQGWKIVHRGGWLYDHHCPNCERLRQAPQAYWDRLVEA